MKTDKELECLGCKEKKPLAYCYNCMQNEVRLHLLYRKVKPDKIKQQAFKEFIMKFEDRFKGFVLMEGQKWINFKNRNIYK